MATATPAISRTVAPQRPRSTLFSILLLWIAFYSSFTLFMPALLDDADSVHVEVAREMLLRHDYVTLYANGIRYLEKAPLLYWAMAVCMKLASLFGISSPTLLAAAARIPLALAMLALAFAVESFARRLFQSQRAGLYAALITLSSFGLFIFTRITIPDAAVCLWTTLALYCFWRTEELQGGPSHPLHHLPRQHHPRLRWISFHPSDRLRLYCGGFAAACALNVLTKGLIGVVFPAGIVVVHLLLTRGWRRATRRIGELHPWTSLEAFLLIAAPWHILAALANPTEGHPARLRFLRLPGHVIGHWIVPLPTLGNVHGWLWFYFMNEHVLRYLNLRVPHDYGTSPLWLFWGLCLVWLMPWSAFGFKAMGWAAPFFGATKRAAIFRSQLRRHDLPLLERGRLLLLVWAAFILLFFAFSTRQEYYVLPALPAVAILIAGWLAHDFSFNVVNLTPAPKDIDSRRFFFLQALRNDTPYRAAYRCTIVLLVFGAIFASFAVFFLFHAHTPPPGADLAALLTQHPSDYALSMGHFLDLDTRALGLFHAPLILSVLALFLGPLGAVLLRRRAKPHAANIALFAATFVFLLAADLALQTFAPVLSSAQLAQAIAPQVRPQDMIAIHGEYESGSTLAFYLKRPIAYPAQPSQYIHILEGRSSNLWYGSFFLDAPQIFETPATFAAEWAGPRRIFLWQSVTDSDAPLNLPPLPTPVYILAKSGGKEIVSNQPNH